MARWVPACATADIPPEDVVPFDHEGRAYAVYHSPDGQFYATAGQCTHEQELLCDGLVSGRVIECPIHNGRFDYVTGQALGAPAIVDIRTFPTRVEGDTVYIEVP